jgi:hypothetical protein
LNSAILDTGAVDDASVATGDVKDNGTPDIILSTISNGISQVQVLDGTPLQPFQEFSPFAATTSLTSLAVSSEDVNYDGISDIVVSTGSRLKIFNGKGDVLLASFVLGGVS